MRWSTPGMRIVARSKFATACKRSPRAKMITERRQILSRTRPRGSPAARRRARAKGIATPTMNRKKGKIRSVGVQPCQSACRSGAYTARHVPGLLTSTIAATVNPRNTSSERSRRAGTFLRYQLARALFGARLLDHGGDLVAILAARPQRE